MNKSAYKLTRFVRESTTDDTQLQLQQLVGHKLFDVVFAETANVKQTHQIIESFTQALTDVASNHRTVTEAIDAMNKIDPNLTKHVFNEDSDNTIPQESTGRAFVVTYIDADNNEHTVEQKAYSPSSIRKRLEGMGFDVKDIKLSSTGESVLDETVTSRHLNALAESILADIDHHSRQVSNSTNIFNRNVLESNIKSYRDQLDKLIERGKACGMDWDDNKKKFNRRANKRKTNEGKFSLSDVFKR